MERGKDMKYGDPDYRRQLDVITAIPSNKFDADDLSKHTTADMDEFNVKHLRDLREQVRGYDDQELTAVAEEIAKINFTILHNVLGEYFISMYTTLNSTKKVINEE